MNVATILAGGRGTRLGAPVPKQYMEVLGKPVLAYTLEVFQSAPDIDALQVVCQPEYIGHVKDIARKYRIEKLRWITSGGQTCPQSIRNGIFALGDFLNGGDNIILHMGVSPLVSHEDIASALKTCAEKGCCFTMHPVNICMAYKSGENWCDKDAPKENYVELNTPWAFRYAEILSLYREFEEKGVILSEGDYTLSLWLASGRRAYYAPGSAPGRMKITTAHDLDLFEGYLTLRRQRIEKAHNTGGSHE